MALIEQSSQYVTLLNIPLTFQFAGKDTKNEQSKNGKLQQFKRESERLPVLGLTNVNC